VKRFSRWRARHAIAPTDFARPPDFEILPDDDLPMPDLPTQESHARFSARRLLNAATGLVVVIALIAATPLWLPAISDLWQKVFPAQPGPSIYVQEGSTLVALRTRDGHEIWHVDHISSTSRAYLYNGVIYALSADTTNAIVAVHATDGHIQWQYQTGNDVVQPIAVADQHFYVIRGQQVMALDVASGQPAWDFALPSGSMNDNFQLYFGDGQVLTCAGSPGKAAHTISVLMISRDAATGSVRWQRTVDGIPAETGDTCLLLDGMPMVSYGDSTLNTLLVFDLRQGQPRWQLHVKGNVVGVDQAAIYLDQSLSPQKSQIVAYDISDGQSRWALPGISDQYANVLSTAENGQFGAGRNAALVVQNGAELEGVDGVTGLVRWHAVGSTDGRTLNQAAVGAAGVIYYTNQNQTTLSALKGTTGAILWHVPNISLAASQEPGQAQTMFFWQDALFITGGSQLLAIDPATGKVRWHLAASVAVQPVFTTTDFIGNGQP